MRRFARLACPAVAGLIVVGCTSSGSASPATTSSVALTALGTETTAPAPLRILALGDSITEGNYYRPPLVRLLAADGCAVDFVGSMSDTVNTPEDPEHEGHGGWRADEIATNARSWVQAADPDVVLVHVGINDFWQGQDVASTIADVAATLDAIESGAPGATVLLAQILPGDSIEAKVTEFNAGLRQLTTASTRNLEIDLVDQNSGVDARPTGDTVDGTHPNAAASQRMADRWRAALAPRLAGACT